MPVEKIYSAQLIVMDTIDRAGAIRAWADKVPQLTLSNLIRDAFDRGWSNVERELIERHGALTPGELWAGKLSSVPKADRQSWTLANPMPKVPSARARKRTASAVA
jgi:hypothetical protein